MAHVVVAVAEAVGGEEFFEVLAQGGRFTGQVGAGDRFGGADQVLMQVAAALVGPINGTCSRWRSRVITRTNTGPSPMGGSPPWMGPAARGAGAS